MSRPSWRRAAAEGLANVSFEQADVQVHPFADGAFDAAISSFGAVLGAAGFGAVELEPVDEPVWLGDDADDAWGFVRTMGIVKGLTQDLEPADRERAFASVRAALAAAEGPGGVEFASSAWLVTAARPPS